MKYLMVGLMNFVMLNTSAGQVTLNVIFDESFSEDQEIGLMSELNKRAKYMNTVEFKTRVLDHKYRGMRAFALSNGLSNLEVYNTIMQAQEWNTSRDNVIDLNLKMFTSSFPQSRKLVYNNGTDTFVNDKILKVSTYRVASFAILSNWLQSLGFRELYRFRTPGYGKTVPAGIKAILKK